MTMTVEDLKAQYPAWKIWASDGGLLWATSPYQMPTQGLVPADYARTVGCVKYTGELLKLIEEQESIAGIAV